MAKKLPNEGKNKLLKGVFYDSPVEGLEYKTQSVSGLTGAGGIFQYRAGETVTFSVGGLVLGSIFARKFLTPGDLAMDVGDNVGKLRGMRVTGLARFIQSLDSGGNIEDGIVISEKTREIVGKYRYDISFDQPEEAFTGDPPVKALFAELGRRLRTPAEARNHLRRSIRGIKKMTDVKVPTRDGSYMMADVFRPIEDGKYPVVMSLGGYGKAFSYGCIRSEADQLKFEEIEDEYFFGRMPDPSTFSPSGEHGHPRLGHISENFEVANTVDWVPKGYVVIRVDERGVGASPGRFEQFSLQESRDYYDAIEWAGTQPWSNGNVGLWGASYFGMNQYLAASQQPPHLKAMIPIAGDINSYRDYIYTGGGLYNPFNFVSKNANGEWQGVDWVKIAKENPFDDPAVYGPEGSICISPDPEKIVVPFWGSMGTEGTIHTRGSSEAFIHAGSKHKKLLVLSEAGEGIHAWSFGPDYLRDHMAFFDYWLKGIENGIMDEPPVRMMVRTGWGGYYWQYENEWPPARAQYTKLYLNAVPSPWKGDGRRQDFMQLQGEVPGQEAKSAYKAEVKPGERNRAVPFAPPVGGDPPWSHGVCFATEPLSEDTLIAGYLKLVVWVSSSTEDMQLHVTVRVVDENNVYVPYAVGNRTRSRTYPAGQGALKVSHRKLDPAKSTIYRPYHTHLKADYQPLQPGEIVEAQVEIWPTTALVRKGHRIVLYIQPTGGEGLMDAAIDVQGNQYQKGAANTVYTGPAHPSYLQLPVIPPK